MHMIRGATNRDHTVTSVFDNTGYISVYMWQPLHINQ